MIDLVGRYRLRQRRTDCWPRSRSVRAECNWWWIFSNHYYGAITSQVNQTHRDHRLHRSNGLEQVGYLGKLVVLPVTVVSTTSIQLVKIHPNITRIGKRASNNNDWKRYTSMGNYIGENVGSDNPLVPVFFR